MLREAEFKEKIALRAAHWLVPANSRLC